MANKKEEFKDIKPKKKTTGSSNSSKRTTTKKNTTSKVSTTKKASTNTTKKKTTNNSKANTKSVNKSNNKKTEVKKATPKVKKDLEKTVIIENIENEINKIVENKNDISIIEEQVIENINNIEVAKVEDAKYVNQKRNKKLLAIGVIISLLGIIALIITLIANRIVDREFISDNSIALMVIASILIECFGAFIIINES